MHCGRKEIVVVAMFLALSPLDVSADSTTTEKGSQDGIGRHFLAVSVDPATGVEEVKVVRVD